MKKLGITLYTIFALLFLGLPIFVLKMSLQGAAEFDVSYWPWWGLAALAVLVCLIPRELPQVPDWLLAPLWGCAAFQYRWHCFYGIEKYMVMRYDFGDVLESVKGTFLIKEVLFTHWAFYPRILEGWDNYLGEEHSYRSAVYFNLLVSGIIVALVYLIARRVWRRQRAAIIAAAALCFWPSFSYYACVTSNEHLAMLFMLLASLFAILTWQLKDRRWLRALTAVLAGLSAGAADLFKQFSPVFLIASFGAALVFLLLEGEQAKRTAKSIVCLLLCLALMFASTLALKEPAYRWLEGKLGMPVCRNATAHFLWIGLNSKGGGMWSADEGAKVYKLAEQYDYDYDRVMGELMTLMKDDLRENRELLGETIAHKMREDWRADIGVTLWVKAMHEEREAWRDAHPGEDDTWVPTAELDEFDFDPGYRIAASSAAFYICVMALVLLGAVLALALRNPSEMYLRLIFYGYALLFLASEAQGRYQIVLFPLFALLAAGGAEVAGYLPQRILDRKRRLTEGAGAREWN